MSNENTRLHDSVTNKAMCVMCTTWILSKKYKKYEGRQLIEYSDNILS